MINQEPKLKGNCDFCGEPSNELVIRKFQEDEDLIGEYALCPDCLNDYEKELEEITSHKTNGKPNLN